MASFPKKITDLNRYRYGFITLAYTIVVIVISFFAIRFLSAQITTAVNTPQSTAVSEFTVDAKKINALKEKLGTQKAPDQEGQGAESSL